MKNTRIQQHILGGILLFGAAFSAQASNAELMPTGQWEDNEHDVIWMRCAIGQEFRREHCEGNPKAMTWNEAKNLSATYEFAGQTWRLPTEKELMDIRHCSRGWARGSSASKDIRKKRNLVEKTLVPNYRGSMVKSPLSCVAESYSPAIKTHFFPGTPVDKGFWSSSNKGDIAWGVHFNIGFSYVAQKGMPNYVRLVRDE